MLPDPGDTIAAPASAPAPALRGIIRLSGRDVVEAVRAVCVPSTFPDRLSSVPRRYRVRIQLAAWQLSVPAALHLWPTDRSYTGEPMAEFHLVGCAPLTDAVLQELAAGGVRSAGRGEFTMRSFLNGKLDLLQAEAVLGVIEATDHEQLQTALQQLGGGLTGRLRSMKSELIAMLGDLEAGLDFVEEDIEFISHEEVLRRLSACHRTVADLLEQSETSTASGYRSRVVLAGLPNAGKSTLFNKLAGDAAALVSPVAGTTRDFLTATTEVSGHPVELIDTAGWEEDPDAVMQEAGRLRAAQLETANLIVWCTSADLTEQQLAVDHQHRESLQLRSGSLLHVITRSDRGLSGAVQEFLQERPLLQISAVSGSDYLALPEAIQRAMDEAGTAAEFLGSSAARCRTSLQRCSGSLSAALEAAELQLGDEVISVGLRDALADVADILGEVYTDDVLDHIFSHFCIGK